MSDLSLDTVLADLVDRAVARRVAPILEKLDALTAREPDEWVSVEDAARALDVEPVTARRMAARGDLAAKKCGKVWRIARSSLRARTDQEVAVLAADARR